MHLTVGICTWNRSALLRDTLESFEELHAPDGVTWELLVCDNNSSDDTKQVVESFTEKLSLRYLFEGKQGKSNALNTLLGEATGEWILWTDDDLTVEPNWLAKYVEAFEAYPEAVCFGGRVLPRPTRPTSRRENFLMKEFCDVFALREFTQPSPMTGDNLAIGANMATRADVMSPGIFDTDVGPRPGRVDRGEETLMLRGLLEAGHKGWMVPGPTTYHHLGPERLSFRFFCQWQVGIGRCFYHRHRDSPSPNRPGVWWWVWKLVLKHASLAVARWRPWPTRGYYEAVRDACREYGYLTWRGDETGVIREAAPYDHRDRLSGWHRHREGRPRVKVTESPINGK